MRWCSPCGHSASSRGDRVIVPANSFFATAEAVSLVAAVPALVDCDPLTRTISVAAVGRASCAHAVAPG